MKKSLVASIGCLLLFACSAGAQRALKTAYYPLEVGQRWTYRMIDLKSPQAKTGLKRKVVIEVDRPEPYVEKKTDKENKVVEKKYTGFLLKMTGGRTPQTDHVVVTEEGIRRIHAAGTAMTPPLLFFKLPLKPGESWQANSVSGNTTIKGTFTATAERVSVPKGDFDALRIAYRGKNVEDQVEIDCWFVQGIGMVKQRVRAKNHEIVLELEKFENAK